MICVEMTPRGKRYDQTVEYVDSVGENRCESLRLLVKSKLRFALFSWSDWPEELYTWTEHINRLGGQEVWIQTPWDDSCSVLIVSKLAKLKKFLVARVCGMRVDFKEDYLKSVWTRKAGL
jgi:hypothetical protein